jgi:hypothetical protein
VTDPRPWEWPEERWRGLVGRVRAGRRLRPASWPGGARCAVGLSFDCDHETFEMGAGGEAIGRLAWGEFGRRVGVPRILSVLERHGVPATFFCPAVAALIGPEEPARIAAAGHEIGIHGWIHENTSILDAATERALMLRRARHAGAAVRPRPGRPPRRAVGHQREHGGDRAGARAALRQQPDGRRGTL